MTSTFEKIKKKQCVVGIVGLDDSGLTQVLDFAEAGIAVHGVDFDENKVNAIRHGDVIFDPERWSQYSEHFSISSDHEVLTKCDAIIVHGSEDNLKEIHDHVQEGTVLTYEPYEKEPSLQKTLEKLSTAALENKIHLCCSSERTVIGMNTQSQSLGEALYGVIYPQVESKLPIGDPLTVERIKTKNITVGVIGLGYVGFPLSLVFAEAGVSVIGFDVDQEKIDAIHEGTSYIRHINDDRLKSARKTNKISATMDYARVSECDAIIICVPTPLDHHLEPDLRYVVETCKAIAPHLKPKTLVSLESTTWPGTTDEIVRPILEKEGPRRFGKDLYLCFSPEREDPGNPIFGTKTIPKLIGGADEKSLELAVALYSLSIEKVVPLSSTKVAELAKLFENIFRSVNIALVNELKVICEPMGIDVWEVIQAAGTKPFGFMPFWPGPGLGGHCIPIDPFYLTWKAKEYGITTRFIELAGEINRSMPHYVVNKVQDCLNNFSKAVKGSRILILGLSYKSDIDDMRESPSLELIKILEEKGAQVDYYDPFIPEIGKTREYSQLAGRKHQKLSKDYDCFVISTKHSCFSQEDILSFGIPIVDTRNFLPRNHQLVYPA